MAKCKPNYKNLNEIQSYSEQKYATTQWADQNCENDEYLKQEVDELNYKSPARIRKRWKPIVVDDDNSYGHLMNPNQEVTFSDVTNLSFIVDFNDFSLIDRDRSDCDFKTYTDGSNVEHQCATVPPETTSTLNTDCRNMTDTTGINSFWYVGFDKNKPYQVRPDWLKKLNDLEIPAVCRAQTITIPSGIQNGILESVDLRIENNGTTNSNWGSPLIVQIWKTEKKKVEKTQWDKKKKKSVSYNPKQYEYIYFPVGHPNACLASCEFQPNKITPKLQNFKFDKGVEVNSGEHYAIVMSSPLSHWDHCPRIGGWGRNCAKDKYTGGDAFLSEKNGRHWKRYGKTDTTLGKGQYRLGLWTPLDFGFRCHIRQYSNGYDKDEDFYLYLKPIMLNPIKSIQLVPVGYGDEAQLTNLKLEFQVSQSGRANSWTTLNPSDLSINFNPDPTTGEYPHFAFIRVKMATAVANDAPYLDSLKVICNMDSPKEMYVRTMKYTPKATPMLGAAAWSKVFSDFEVEPGVTGTAEIIKEQPVMEHFDIITANELESYTDIDGLDISKITDPDLEVRYNYLMNTPAAIKLLKENKVYVKPYTYTSGGQSVTHPMCFDEGIKFDNSPAYPIVSGSIQPLGNEPEIPVSEWIDYKFDYDNDLLIFNSVMNQYTDDNNQTVTEGIAEYLPVGTLEMTYQPIFIQDLTNTELGIREDSEGFVLDYFKEEITINENDVENRYVDLKFEPCDPIRELVIDDVEYLEDIHFTVDYLNNRIIFPVTDVNQSSTLLNENLNKDMHVVYTPNLDDSGLVIGYRGIRTATDKQMRIKSNYLEYKV